MKIALLTLMLLPATAFAQQTTYSFYGAAESGMTVTTTGSGMPVGASSPSCCLILNGFITLAAPLGDNLSDAAVTPSYAYFGFGTPDTGGPLVAPGLYAGPGVNGNADASTSLDLSILDFSTNSSGQITDWDLALSGVPLSFESFTATSTPGADTAQYADTVPNITGGNLTTVSDDGGSYWLAVPSQSAPEINPAGALEALTLLAGTLLILRGRRTGMS